MFPFEHVVVEGQMIVTLILLTRCHLLSPCERPLQLSGFRRRTRHHHLLLPHQGPACKKGCCRRRIYSLSSARHVSDRFVNLRSPYGVLVRQMCVYTSNKSRICNTQESCIYRAFIRLFNRRSFWKIDLWRKLYTLRRRWPLLHNLKRPLLCRCV